MENKKLISLLNNTKKQVSIFDYKGTFICEGCSHELGQHLGSTLYNSEVLFIKEDDKEVSVVISVELKKVRGEKIWKYTI